MACCGEEEAFRDFLRAVALEAWDARLYDGETEGKSAARLSQEICEVFSSCEVRPVNLTPTPADALGHLYDARLRRTLRRSKLADVFRRVAEAVRESLQRRAT